MADATRHRPVALIILDGFGVYGNSGAFARFDTAVVDTGEIPEPGTALLLGAGLVFLGFAVRRRRARAAH